MWKPDPRKGLSINAVEFAPSDSGTSLGMSIPFSLSGDIFRKHANLSPSLFLPVNKPQRAQTRIGAHTINSVVSPNLQLQFLKRRLVLYSLARKWLFSTLSSQAPRVCLLQSFTFRYHPINWPHSLI